MGRDSGLGATACAGAAIALGYAVQVANGNLAPDAILWLSVALVLALAGVFVPRVAPAERVCSVALPLLMAAGLAFQFSMLATHTPGIYLQLRDNRDFLPYTIGLVVSALLVGSALSRERLLGPVHVPAILLAHFFLGVWLIHASPNPSIDVYVFQRDSSNALLHGQNPYAITFPDIYGASPFYGPGVSVGGRVLYGFPYPPLSLLLALPAHVFAGDYRYSQLVAMLVAAGFMAYARPGRVGAIAGALFLFTCRVFFVLEQGWTEPFVVALLAACVFFAIRFPRPLPYLLGLFLAVKQYLVFAVPLTFLVLPRPIDRQALLRFVAKAAAVGALVTLPFVIINPMAFWRDVVAWQTVQPFRAEALSYLAWWAQGHVDHPPTSLAFITAFVVLGLALWRAPRTPGGFAAAVAAVFATFFAFNKQAFCNYYFFVIGALCVAVAASDSGGADAPRVSA
jgi:hypothetical protein